MTDLISYLSNYREETPVWLEHYLQGEQITFKDIMSSRVAYYPGSGDDGTLIKVCNISKNVHEVWAQNRMNEGNRIVILCSILPCIA